MFAKLRLDSSCFYVLNSTKTSPNIGVSVSPLENFEPINKQREQRLLESHNGGGVKKFGGVHMWNYGRSSVLVCEPRLDKAKFVKAPDEEQGNSVNTVEKREVGVEVEGLDGDGGAEKVHKRCSTKWVYYGGCLPEVLQALDTIKDLDEAFRPWAERLHNKERSIILKEQSSWERALEIFEWFKRKGCYELNVIHYNIMLRTLGKAHKWSHVVDLWSQMNINDIAPINSTYGTLIDVYSKGGLKKEALCWLASMNKQGMEPDEVTMGIVVQMYKKLGEFERAEEVFKKWSSGETVRHDKASTTINGELKSESQVPTCLSLYTYNTLIDTYGKAGKLKEASETFAQMLKEGIVPTTVTFNTIIHAYGIHGMLEEVASLMKKMEELQCPPDTRTYNILISLHVKHDNISMAASYFTRMKETSLEPDLVTYRTLLYAYSIRHMVVEAEDLVLQMDQKGLEIDEYTQSALTRMYIEADMLDKSWLWFRRFHFAGNLSSEGYSANIDAYGERGHTLEAEKVFMSCLEVQRPTVLEFNVMIKAYGIGKCYDKACQLFDSMKCHGIVPDKCSYSSLIQILAGANLPHIAKPYLQKMCNAGFISDCVPYCAVISSFVKLGRLERAEELYKEMVAYNVKPDVIVYGVLLNAFADAGCVKEAISYVNAMKNAGLSENTVIYNSLIKLYAKVGYLKEAQETYKILQLSDEGPDVYSSNCMIDLYSERSMVGQAEEIFKNLKRKGLANEFTFAMVLCMYKRNGRFEEANHIAKQMRELGLLTDLLSYNNVIGLYALDGRFKEAIRTFGEMRNAGIQPDDYTFKSLGAILVKCGIPKKAVKKLEVTRKKDSQSGLGAWISTLSSVVGVDDDNDDD